MSNRDFDELAASLSLIAAALLSISVVLWMFYLNLDDVAVRVRLVGVALRHWTPLDPRDRVEPVPPVEPVNEPEPPADAAQAKETRSETAHPQ